MSWTETEDAPRQWLRFSDEPPADPDAFYAGPTVTPEDEALERHLKIAARVGVVGFVVVGLLALCSAAGYSVGPGNGERTICEAAHGHTIDRVVVHRCAP